MTAPNSRQLGPLGTIPGLWPQAGDAPLLVPLAGTPKLPKELRDTGTEEEQLQLALWIGHDRLYSAPIFGGIPVAPANVDKRVPGVALGTVHSVQPGVLSGLSEPAELRLPEAAQLYPDAHVFSSREYYRVGDGPAVRLGLDEDIFLPTPDPVRLASEIERRRQRVLHRGGYGVETPPPSSDVTAEYGTNSIAPTLPKGAGWQPMRPAPIGEKSPASAGAAGVVPTNVAYPETVPNIAVALRNAAPPLHLTVTPHRLSLSQRELPPVSPVYLAPEIPEPHPHLGIPLARFLIVRAGTLSGVPAGWCTSTLAPDASTELRVDIADGAAVWLWGPFDEFVISIPGADRLAADIRQRQQIGALYPVPFDLVAERVTWKMFPELRPADGPQGRALPPVPCYAPVQPTVVPAGTWTPTG